MKLKKLLSLLTILVLTGGLIVSVIPQHAQAYGGSRSFSSRSSSFGSSSRSSSFGSRSSYSRPTTSSRTSSSSSRPKVSLSKSSTTTKKSSFSGATTTKKKPATTSTTSTAKKSSFSGKSSTVKKSTVSKSSTGSFSGRTSTVRGRTASYSKPYRTYYGGHYVSVNHYYSVGYDPFMWGGYYSGFSYGMFMGSLWHPYGGTYYVNGAYTHYGTSPIAWILDIIALLIVLSLIIWTCVAFSPSRKVYRRKF